MAGYSYAAEEEVLAVFAAATARQQRRLLDCFRQIAAAPFRAPDYVENDADGRALAVILHDDWLVTYWADHAVKKVLIVEVEAVEGP